MNYTEEEIRDGKKRPLGSLAQFGLLLWAAGLAFVFFLPAMRIGVSYRGLISPYIFVAGMALVVLATPVSVIAIWKRKKGDYTDVFLAIFTILCSLTTFCLLTWLYIQRYREVG